MRIDQIDIDIPGWSALSGTLRFPAEGVALWAGANETGKSMLVPLMSAALYGVPRSGNAIPHSGWLMVRITLDQGEGIVVARDLGTGMLQVTDHAGTDVTDRWSDAPSLGEGLLGFTRGQFLQVASVGLDDLELTVAHPGLRAMLGAGRGVASPAPTPAAASPAAPQDASASDLPIFRSAAEEMEWVASSHFSPGDRVLALESSATWPAPGPKAAPREAEAAAHELKRALDSSSAELAAKDAEYHQFRERLAELRAEQARLDGLEGAEPGDVARLEELVGQLKTLADHREQVRLQEGRFREDLAERSIHAEQLEPMDRALRELTDDDRSFLGSHRQMETILRGNQALTRSESRLDESRIQVIERERDGASRLAIGPLVIAMLGLFGSVAMDFLPPLPFPMPPSAPLAAGLLGTLAGAAMLWRAKRLRAGERRELIDTLGRKREQLAQFERQADAATVRLAELAETFSLEDGPSLLRQYGTWQSHLAELSELTGFQKRMKEIDRESAALRDRLASFTVAEDPTEMTDSQLDAMVDDYIRHFTIRDEIAAADARAGDFEAALAESEGALADLRARITATLEAEGIDSNGNLAEAIEILARRTAPPPVTGTTRKAPAPSAPGAWREIDPDALSQDDATTPPDIAPAAAPPRGAAVNDEWAPALSARMEAILRRWIPGARSVEIDADLVPHLRLDPAGPRISGPDFAGCGSATRDHVCLALRLAIVETLSAAGERVPVFLDDPFVRSDDARHDLAIRFLVEDASKRGQVVYLTSHEVRIRWFQHQHPQHRDRLVSVRDDAAAARSACSDAPVSEPSASSSPSVA